MKNTKRKLFCILCCILLFTFPLASFAHSGRTDANGGHHDYKNKSGLGDYHYHHGMGPHLHPNGVCPYSGGSTDNSGSSSSSASQASTYTPPAPSISIENYPETLDVGASAGLEYSVSNATSDDSSVTSSNSDIVKVNPNGTLTAVNEGTAQITINASGITKTFSVSVKAVPVEEVRISNIMERIQLGEEHHFQTEILTKNATNKNVIWE